MQSRPHASQIGRVESQLTMPVLANINYSPAVQEADLSGVRVFGADEAVVERLRHAKDRATAPWSRPIGRYVSDGRGNRYLGSLDLVSVSLFRVYRFICALLTFRFISYELETYRRAGMSRNDKGESFDAKGRRCAGVTRTCIRRSQWSGINM